MKALFTSLLLILATNSFADEMRYYDVEIVIIENLDINARNAEIWPLEVNLKPAERTITLGESVKKDWLPQDVDMKLSYRKLRSSSYQLNEYIEKISESEKQRVIYHTAWRQPGLSNELSLPIYFKREVAAAPTIDEQQQTEGTLAPNNVESLPSVLEGILRVTLARYLHLEAELTFRTKLPEITRSDNPFSVLDNEKERSQLQKQGVIHFKQERRRIRSTELHYLDHPALSILVLMTPYENPDDDVTASAKN